MALKTTITIQGGVSVADAYVNIVPDVWKKDESGNWYACANLRAWTSQAARDAGESPLVSPAIDRRKITNVDLSTITTDPLTWWYAQLKDMPEFADAVDA